MPDRDGRVRNVVLGYDDNVRARLVFDGAGISPFSVQGKTSNRPGTSCIQFDHRAVRFFPLNDAQMLISM